MTTGIYSLIDKKRLHSVLQTLSRCTGLHVRLIDADGGTLCAFGTGAAYCRELNEKVFPEKTCVKLHADAGRQAQKLGEAYIFNCQAELSQYIRNSGILRGFYSAWLGLQRRRHEGNPAGILLRGRKL